MGGFAVAFYCGAFVMHIATVKSRLKRSTAWWAGKAS
jgi:hypothetical protein